MNQVKQNSSGFESRSVAATLIGQLCSTLRKYLFCIFLFAFVLVSRSLTSGPVYFADGPAHLKAIADGTFVIQPPGYWLFNRLAALFCNPERAILVFNWLVSACGAIVFYRIGQLTVAPYMAKLSAILYASVFFAWFSGNVHSTYASQLLFPLLTIYLMLRFRRSPSSVHAVGVGLSFAIGAGLRPSDGAFLGPLILYFAIRYLSKRQAAICILTAAVGCLLWLIPTLIALHHFATSTLREVGSVSIGAILLGRFNLFTVSNALRFFLPLTIALGPILPFAFMSHSPFRQLIWVAILPGSAFFLLVYIADAPYLNFLLGATLLLCVQGMEFKLRRPQASAVLVAAILLNVSTYLFFQPISLPPGKAALVALIVNKDIGAYTHTAVVNRWMFTIQGEMNKHPRMYTIQGVMNKQPR